MAPWRLKSSSRPPFSTSMIMGDRVRNQCFLLNLPVGSLAPFLPGMVSLAWRSLEKKDCPSTSVKYQRKYWNFGENVFIWFPPHSSWFFGWKIPIRDTSSVNRKFLWSNIVVNPGMNRQMPGCQSWHQGKRLGSLFAKKMFLMSW